MENQSHLWRLNPLYFGSLVPTIGEQKMINMKGLNPLYFGSLVPTRRYDHFAYTKGS